MVNEDKKEQQTLEHAEEMPDLGEEENVEERKSEEAVTKEEAPAEEKPAEEVAHRGGICCSVANIVQFVKAPRKMRGSPT